MKATILQVRPRPPSKSPVDAAGLFFERPVQALDCGAKMPLKALSGHHACRHGAACRSGGLLVL